MTTKTESAVWAARADELMRWTVDRLVMRTDAWVAYGAKGPYTRKEKLTEARILQHFRATSREHVIGLHSGSPGPDSTAKGIAADIDAHGHVTDDLAANWKAAEHWYGEIIERGLTPLLTDSNGNGGYHLRVLFSEPIPLHVAHAAAHWIFTLEVGFPEVEVFPKQAKLAAPDAVDGRYGNCLRIPGRHHKRDHWSKVWNGSNWLSGGDAISFMLAMKGDDPAPILAAYAEFQSEQEAERKAEADALEAARNDRGTDADRHRRYGQAAILRACNRIANAPDGQKHFKLRDEAFSLGHLVPNYLTPGEIQACLEEAIRARGAEDDIRAAKTIKSGIEKGAKNPRPPLPPAPRILIGNGKPSANGTGIRNMNGQGSTSQAISTPASEPWPEPIQLYEEPNVPEFPVSVFPPELARYVTQLAKSLNAPVDFVATSVLDISAGMIGNARRLKLSDIQEQPALIYAAMVGLPGTVKSPVLKLLTAPLDRIQMQWNQEYLDAMEEWNKDKDDEETEKKPRPQLKVLVARNATTESIAHALHYNPRGFVQPFDELAGLFCGLNQYKSSAGNDRQFYLSCWAQETINVLRKIDLKDGIPPLFVVNPCLSIIGGIQPDLLATIRGRSARRGEPIPDDGGLDRFLVTWPKTLPDVADEPGFMSQSDLAIWPCVVDMLVKQLPYDPTTKSLVALSGEAQAQWLKLTRAHAAEVNDPEFPEHLRGAWAKFKGYAGRLTLVIHVLRWACGERVEGDIADAESVLRARQLVDYFKGHCRKVHACMETDPRIPTARKLLKWIIRQQASEFSRRDAYHAVKGTVKTVDGIDPILNLLTNHYIIRPVTPTARQGPGRCPSQKFQVNPGVISGNCGDSGNHFQGDDEAEEGDRQTRQSGSHNPHNSQNSTPHEKYGKAATSESRGAGQKP